jgi:hypothetical protein
MKKLLLVLSATILSLAAMAQLNPYAYGLSSDWDATNQTLTVDFKLNAHPNLDVTANGNGTGIQIFAVDRDNNNKMYYIHGIPAAEIRKKIDSDDLDYSVDIHINGRSIEPNECLPKGKKLTFAVRVQGVNSKNKTVPGTPVYTGNRPFSPHGVAVNNCQDSQDFGAVYVTECTNGVSGNTWGWLSDKGKSLLKYDPRLKYEVSYRKNPDFSVRANNYLEPHRVRVSEDGRIFVSSYNRVEKNNSMQNQVAVWEYKNGAFTPLIYHNSANTGGLSANRLCGMDVKGSGNNLKLLLCFLDESDTGGQWANSLYVIEYSGTNLQTKTYKLRYRPDGSTSNHTNKLNPWSEQGALEVVRLNSFNCYYDGFVNIAYAGQNKDDIIMAIDYFYGYDYNARMFYFRNPTLQSVGDKTIPNYAQVVNQRDHYYGGAGLLRYVYNGDEYALSGRAQFGQYNGDGTNTENSGRIQAYKVSGTSIANSATSAYSKSDLKTLKIINDIALDCANNVYAVSFTDGANSTTGGSGNLLAYAMPYSGTVTTYCPTSNTDDKEYFQLPAVVELNQDLDTDALQQLNKNHPNDCGCDINVNLVRPLRGGMYNTICLPFDLDVKTLDSNHPYYNATVLAFKGATISTINDESVLELNFESTNGVINHSKPYLIRPQNDISSGVRFDNITLQPVQAFLASDYLVTNNDINYLGIMGGGTFTFDPNEEIVLVLVNDNRLAQLSSGGAIKGFRGFFYFDKSVISEGTVVRLAERKDTPTSLIDAQVKTIDIQKFLREGRVYIRVGESLYNMDGVKVE